MKITPKLNFVSGSFDTEEVRMVCVPDDNHGEVALCVNEEGCGWNIPIGYVKLHSEDLYVDFKATLTDASILGREIARRWNECEEWHECKVEGGDEPKIGDLCILRVLLKEEDEPFKISYVTSVWGEYGWYEDNLRFVDHYEGYKITHWKKVKTLEVR